MDDGPKSICRSQKDQPTAFPERSQIFPFYPMTSGVLPRSFQGWEMNRNTSHEKWGSKATREMVEWSNKTDDIGAEKIHGDGVAVEDESTLGIYGQQVMYVGRRQICKQIADLNQQHPCEENLNWYHKTGWKSGLKATLPICVGELKVPWYLVNCPLFPRNSIIVQTSKNNISPLRKMIVHQWISRFCNKDFAKIHERKTNDGSSNPRIDGFSDDLHQWIGLRWFQGEIYRKSPYILW